MFHFEGLETVSTTYRSLLDVPLPQGPVPQQWVLEQLFLKPSPRRPGDTCQGWPVIRQGTGDTCQGWPAPVGPRILNNL